MNRQALRAFYGVTVLALFLPPVLIVATSFKANAIVGFPIGPLSLRWYATMLDDAELWRAASNSALAAIVSTVLAVFIGTWTAMAIHDLRSRWLRLGFLAAAMIPLVTPGIVHGIALRLWVRAIGLQPGVTAIILGHAIHAAPYAIILVLGRLALMPTGLGEAARDLGATPLQRFRHITLAWLAPALLGAAVLSLLSSFDDFVRSFFLGGYRATLPVLVYGRLLGGLTPEINAIASITLAFAGLAALWRTPRR
jgi:spermidine/putrescine transport system permease protein